MKDGQVSNLLAVMADAEQRSTALLVELIAATALFKLNPPEGDAVVTVEITQDDMRDAAKDFFWIAEYDDQGTMRLRLARDVKSLISAQPEEDSEVTSGAD